MSKIADAIEDAHIPSLIQAIVLLTGNTSLLDTIDVPSFDYFSDSQGGIPVEQKAIVRAEAVRAYEEWIAKGKPEIEIPERSTLRRMMNFIAGTDIPDAYLPMLFDELGLDDQASETPAIEQPGRPVKAVVIGAGMSGILAGIRLKKAGVDFTIVDRKPDVGGTWLANSYPGCRVDSPNHLYSYSFRSNEWPHLYSRQDRILDYFRDAAKEHDLYSHVMFSTEVERAVFDDRTASWTTYLRNADGPTHLKSDIVISAVGQLSRPAYPEIPGREDFEGISFHSAEWRHDVDLTGRKVAVIGTGASAFQFVPEIAPQVDHLDVYQRSPPWLMPTNDYHDEVAGGQQWLFDHFPYYSRWYRFWLFWMRTDGALEFVTDDPDWDGDKSYAVSAINARLRHLLEEHLVEQANGDQALVAAVTPHYIAGGKRMLRDNGVWMAALRRNNVSLITDGIESIQPDGIITVDGTKRDVDTIIYGTGFQASKFLLPLEVTGRVGQSLHDRWDGDAKAYLGMMVPGFPNFFMLYGPNTNIVVNGSIIFFSECAMDFVMSCVELIQSGRAETFECSEEKLAEFVEEVDAQNARMAWGSTHVQNWYKNSKGRVSQNWPFSLHRYWEATRPQEVLTLIGDGRGVAE